MRKDRNGCKKWLVALLTAALALLFALSPFTGAARAEGAAESAYRLRICAPLGASVTVDGEALRPEDAIEEGAALLEGLEAYTDARARQQVWLYEGSGERPQVEGRSALGEPLRGVEEEDAVCLFTEEDLALAESREELVRSFFNFYSLYASNPYNVNLYYALLGGILPDSPLYNYVLYSTDAMVWACPTELDFRELTVSEFRSAGENAFTCTLRYDVSCAASTWYGTERYRSAGGYELAFVYQGWNWCAAAMARLPAEPEPDTAAAGIKRVAIAEGTATGELLIVHDPGRVILGTSAHLGQQAGLQLPELVRTYHGVAGINAGGFNDENGHGNGGIPQGLVITGGKIVWGDPEASYSVVGLDGDGVLHVGSMTGQDALDRGIGSAVSFITFDGVASPLILDGKIQPLSQARSINPRTAIGQRADGALLLLVLDGRCFDSLGATPQQTAEILLKYGAVNAGNLDGGSSSVMVCDGEIVSRVSSVTGTRYIPTGFIVLPEEESHG